MTKLFRLFVFLYAAGPLLLVPYWAYSNDNWYLLFGIPFAWFASYSTFSPKLKSFIFLFTTICIGFWLINGFNIHQYITFFYFSSLGGYLLAQIAEQYDQESKRGTLENDDERMEFLHKNPEYLQNKIMEWKQRNPEGQLTFETIDALAKGREIPNIGLAGETLGQMTDEFLKNYIASEPPELKEKIARWEIQNPGKQVNKEIVYALATNKKGTLED